MASTAAESSAIAARPWVHRSAAGVEIGGEAPTGRAAAAIPSFVAAAHLTWTLRQTLWVLVVRDFKARYRAQDLGLFWSLAHPLVMMGTLSVAFQMVLKVQIPDFPIFYLIGAIFWQFVSNSLTATTNSMLDNAALVKRTTFPRFLFPVATVLSNVIHLSMEAVLLVAFVFVFPHSFRITSSIAALPLLVLLLVLLLVGAGLVLSALNVRYRDLYYLVTSLLTVGFWATPVLYATSMAPGGLRLMLRLNPIGGVIEAARQVLMKGEWPSVEHVAPAAAAAVLTFVAGCVVFRRENVRIADLV